MFNVVLTELNTSIDAEPITDVAKVGDVAKTTFPEPVEDVNAVVVFAVPLPVEDRKDGCVAILPERRVSVPGVPVAEA